MNWNELVKTVFPDADDEVAKNFLWSCTCFPCGSVRQVYQQTRKKYRQSKGDIYKCFAIAEEEVEIAMSSLKEGKE